MKFSVVINTYNRAASLEITLESLRYLREVDFEVIVVNGPSTDHTCDVLSKYQGSIRVGSCAERNLSISRNVGIAMAQGDIVAFIDDDAVPDEYWLRDLLSGYDAADVGGVGGVVYDYTGYIVQYRYSASDRFGNARSDLLEPLTDFCYPFCPEVPYLQGTNASFRRDVLLDVGGFDEEFDYYLDETDVCLRVVDAGYRLRQISGGFVYHRYLPSFVRTADRIPTFWRPMIKNKIYFSLVNGGAENFERALLDGEAFIQRAKSDLEWWVRNGRFGDEVLEAFRQDANAAFREGILGGLRPARRLLRRECQANLTTSMESDVAGGDTAARFVRYPTLAPRGRRLTICLLSQEYPPDVVGGIGRMTLEMAEGLGDAGHSTHVITKSRDSHNTVDYEHGVWVHRIADDQGQYGRPAGVTLPEQLWRWSARIYREVQRIHDSHPVDLVDAPIWDAEGLATILSGQFRTVTSLETPLKIALKTNPHWVDGSQGQQDFFEGLIAAEKAAVELSHGVRAISSAVARTMTEEYAISIPPHKLRVVPLGIDDRSGANSAQHDGGLVEVLFVGRFERRKGIDLLLTLAPEICEGFPQARFIFVGADSETQPSGKTRTQDFIARHAGVPFLDRIVFTGTIPDADVMSWMARCDVFVAPSRYESFGLVFLQAMSYGKPVIGCRAGGMPEIIADGETGLLPEPGDLDSLRNALVQLVSSAEKRRTLGQAGRERFLRYFTRAAMIERTIAFYYELLELRP